MQTLLHHRALSPINPCCTPEPFSHALHFVKRLHLQRFGMISIFLWCLPTTCKPPTQNFNRFRPSMHFLHFFRLKRPKNARTWQILPTLLKIVQTWHAHLKCQHQVHRSTCTLGMHTVYPLDVDTLGYRLGCKLCGLVLKCPTKFQSGSSLARTTLWYGHLSRRICGLAQPSLIIRWWTSI